MKRADALADELERRGIAGPAAILMDAHRPLLPLLRQGAIFLGPLLGPLLGPRRVGALREALEDPATYDRVAARLGAERRDAPPQMPNLGELASYLVGLVTDAIGSSEMRLGAVPTVAILIVLLVLLSLIARPEPRWSGRGLGGLGRVGRVMALAAESGADATISLGSAGIGRGASATERFQTLAALPLVGYVADAAARAGVPLRVTTNDPVAAVFARATLAGAHQRTATPERASTAAIEYVGEGRAAAAAFALATAQPHGVAMVAGGLAEDALLMLDGVLGDAEWSVGATASASQAAGPLLDGDGSLIGPELFQAAAEIGAGGHARTAVLAANRLIWGAIGLLLVGSLITWAGGTQVAAFLTGR